MKKKMVLVTGANGFVGSKIIEKLLTLKKYQVSGIVRRTSDLTFIKPFKNKIKLYYGDIRFKKTLLNAFKNQDIVIHTAGYASDWGKYKYFYDVNVKGTKNVAELCLQNGIKHLIHFSSVSIYGFGKRINAMENTKIILNKFYYCRTKLEAEKTIRHFMDVFNLPVTIVQPGSIFGPNDRTMTYKIIDAINSCQFGICDNGKHLFSLLYIDNLIQAVLLIMNKPKKSLKKTYIVTDDLKITWYNFTKYLCDILKRPMPWINVPKFLAMIVALFLEIVYLIMHIKTSPFVTRYRISLIGSDFYFSSKKIKKELGYKPDINIKENLRNTVESYNQYAGR